MGKLIIYGIGPVNLIKAVLDGENKELEMDALGVVGKSLVSFHSFERIGANRDLGFRIKGKILHPDRPIPFEGDYDANDQIAVVKLLR